MNTIVAIDIYPNESEKNVKEFLSKSTQNQKRISITTDLKIEYRITINQLRFKHQFCKFHTKQKLNKDIHNYLTQEKVSKKEKKEIIKIKEDIFKILDCNNSNIAKQKLDKL